MITGYLISLNIRGISNFRKRKTIFTWCRKQKADIIFLQKTHSTEKNEAPWKREWGAPFFCSQGANNARGVAILIRNNFDCIVEQKVADTYGRFLILKVLLNGEQTLLVNIYGPNRGNELVAFYIPLTNRVREPYRKLRTEFFPPRFMAQARSAWAINRRGKNEDP